MVRDKVKEKRIKFWNAVFILLIASALILIMSAGIKKIEPLGCHINIKDVNGAEKMFENTNYEICFETNCDWLDLKAHIDREEISVKDNCININLPKGNYVLEIGNNETRINKYIEIFEKECELNETKECTTEKGCDGTQKCEYYEWGPCYKNKIICIPGSKAGCAITPCIAGTKTCNPCGTGYGPCTR